MDFHAVGRGAAHEFRGDRNQALFPAFWKNGRLGIIGVDEKTVRGMERRHFPDAFEDIRGFGIEIVRPCVDLDGGNNAFIELRVLGKNRGCAENYEMFVVGDTRHRPQGMLELVNPHGRSGVEKKRGPRGARGD